MPRRIGDKDVKAKFAFVCIEPKKFDDKKLYILLRSLLAWEHERIETGEIKSFKVFLESAKLPQTPKARPVTNEFAINGEVALSNVAALEEKIREKQFHKSPAFRKSGKKSTHPPRWLTQEMLIIVVGSPRFLMRNVDLYLEREGLLRDDTFDIVIEVGSLKPFPGSQESYYNVDVAHKSFYRGYVEELGRISGIRFESDEIVAASTSELLEILAERG